MHDALKKEFTLDDFEKAFKNSQPYIETSFKSINIENSVTTLEGTAKTADNCSSKLYFEILEDKIVSFNNLLKIKILFVCHYLIFQKEYYIYK